MNSPRLLLKHFFSFFFYRLLCLKLKTISFQHCLILTYHRILPEEEVSDKIEPGMYVTPSTLREHIRFLKKYFQIVAVDWVGNRGERRILEKSPKPSCILSFDDGWLDFYEHAWPVLREENVPAVVYLPTRFIGSKNRFWTDRLALILEYSGINVLFEQLGGIVDEEALNKIISTQWQFAQAIELLKTIPHQQIDDLLDACETKLGIPPPQSRTFMNWDEVRELFATGLISFGSHTVNHAILTSLPIDKVKQELSLSRQKLLEERVVKDDLSFCYPNGNYSREISIMISENGFSSAVTCDPGWNAAGDNRFLLKRIGLHQDISSTKSLLAYRLAQYYRQD